MNVNRNVAYPYAPLQIKQRAEYRLRGGHDYYFGGGLSPEGAGGFAGGVEVVLESAGGGGVAFESGGVAVPGLAVSLGGGVDDMVEEPLEELSGAVDCCLEQAAMATTAVKVTKSRLRCMIHLT